MDDQPAGLPEQIEIPFVPSTQRQQTNIVDDDIVIVGQKRRKRLKSSAKRHAKLSMDGNTSMASQATTFKPNGEHQEGSATQEPFDYSAIPNLLDDIPAPEHDTTSRKKKKRKQDKGNSLPFYPRTTAYMWL
jgi:exosome complex exonuclease RRP6